MKKIGFIYSLVALFIVATSFTVKFATSSYKVSPTESKVKWVGKKVTGEHSGSIAVKSGEIIMDGKNLKGGSVIIDMTSLTCEDLKDEEYNKKLVGHLKADDFFGVEKYPTSKFEITSVKPVTNAEAGKPNYELKGKLTIKASTQEVTVPALVTSDKGAVTVKANFKVDRTKYDIKYGSASFFDNLGDKAIYDDFEMDVYLVSKGK